MKIKTIYILASFISYSTFCIAQNKESVSRRLDVTVITGYQQEDFNWSIAGNLQGENPNIFSELIWKDLSGVKVGAAIKFKLYKSFYYSASYENTFISSGKVTDADYQNDDRQNQSYFSMLNSNRGNISSVRNALGYQFNITKNTTARMFGGYVINKQLLYLLENGNNNSADIKKLKSTYETNWKGVFVGVDIYIKISDKIGLGVISLYEQLNYKAKANWNMIDAFAHPVSFIHTAKGYGLNNQLKTEFFLNKRFSIHVSGHHYYAITAAGTDELFMTDGAVTYTRLNKVSRKNIGFFSGLTFKF